MLEHDTVNEQYFVEAIADGDADTFLDAISRAVKSRRAELNGNKLYTLNPGDIVKFNSLTRPKYLRGIEAEVVRVNRKRVVVRTEDSRARRFAHYEFTTPVTLVEKV